MRWLLSDASIPSNCYINSPVPSSTNTANLPRIDRNRQNCGCHTLQHSIPGGPLAVVVAPQLHLQRSPVRFVRCVWNSSSITDAFTTVSTIYMHEIDNFELYTEKRFHRFVSILRMWNLRKTKKDPKKIHFLLTQKTNIFIATITKYERKFTFPKPSMMAVCCCFTKPDIDT